MDEKVIVLVSGFMACSISAVAVGYLVTKDKKTTETTGASPGTANLPGKPMPIPQMTKGSKPWNILRIGNPDKISSSAEGVKITYTVGKQGSEAGASFKAAPPGIPAKVATLSYSVFVPESFAWSKPEIKSPGGKLPGLCIGTNSSDCATGGDWSPHAGSFRPMWREGGQVIGYSYHAINGGGDAALNAQTAAFKSVANGTGRTGINLWHKQLGDGPKLQLKKGWNTISMTVDVGTPGKSDGSASLTVNGVTRKVTGVKWREAANVKISNVDFVSFPGGSTTDWAFKKPTYTLYKDFKFSASG